MYVYFRVVKARGRGCWSGNEALSIVQCEGLIHGGVLNAAVADVAAPLWRQQILEQRHHLLALSQDLERFERSMVEVKTAYDALQSTVQRAADHPVLMVSSLVFYVSYGSSVCARVRLVHWPGADDGCLIGCVLVGECRR